ncbi:MAG: hypothetical protein KAJ42_14050, partial [Gemmatimonadetes bacterium]|nr:hypothetical protein [Gemmatimonadota bacterium]
AHAWSPANGSELILEGRWERHRQAWDAVSSDPDEASFRPVFPTDEGVWSSLALAGDFSTPWPGLRLRTRALGGLFADAGFGAVSGGITLERRWLTRGTHLRGELSGGVLLGSPPRQALYLLGGRETVPGYDFRSRVGDRYWLLRGEASTDLLLPFVRLRAFASAGGTGYGGDPLPTPWPQDTSNSFLLSGGVGLGLGWDILRLDLARGLRGGGEWEVVLSVNHDFWAWL